MNKNEKSSSYSHIVRYTGLFGGAQGISILIALLRNKFVATILGPNGMGLISLFTSTITFVSNATNFGIQKSAVRNLSEVYEKGDEQEVLHFVKVIRSWSLLTALFGMFVCIALCSALNDLTFNWGDHTLHFVLLSPIVGLMAVTGGEAAILIATRRLRNLAKISIYNALTALVTSVPLYYFFGEPGIIPSLIIMYLIQLLLTIGYSYKHYPLSLSGSRKTLGEGADMVKLGIAFVAAGIVASGAELLIRSFLNNHATLEVVGLYSAGYMVTMTYAGVVFASMETDYFPRLSSVSSDVEQANLTVNRQIEVSLLLISPLLVFFTIALPVLLPLLYSGKFIPAMGMVQVMVFAMYLRAINMPIAYMSLARGDSRSYLLLETIYAVVLLLLTVVSFSRWGLVGCGIAIAAAALIELLMVATYNHRKYGYTVSRNVKTYALIQLPIGVVAYLVSFIENGVIYWTAGLLLVLVSTVASVTILRKKSSLWASLANKLKRRLHRE